MSDLLKTMMLFYCQNFSSCRRDIEQKAISSPEPEQSQDRQGIQLCRQMLFFPPQPLNVLTGQYGNPTPLRDNSRSFQEAVAELHHHLKEEIGDDLIASVFSDKRFSPYRFIICRSFAVIIPLPLFISLIISSAVFPE